VPSAAAWFRDATPRQWVRRLLVAGVLGFVAVIAVFLLLYASMSLPEEPPRVQTSAILATDGSTITELYKEQNRVDVKLDQVAEVMQQAVVATEDRKFFGHSGLDPIGITRALVNDIRGRELQGGSTITQQLVKNAYLNAERSLVRKVKEAVLAVKVEQQYDKDEILERYLNTIYFGRGAYGVEKAAQLYFGKAAADLDLPQAALLAGLIRAPETAAPERNPEAARQRRAIVLKAMVRSEDISQAEADQANAAPIDAIERPDPTAQLSGGTAWFSAMVREWAIDEFGERLAFGGGLRIETTLDAKKQAAAEQAIGSILDRPDDPDAALVSMTDDGAIVALVGGRDFKTSNVNLATNNVRPQMGSTFKPVVLAAALQNDIRAGQRYPGPAKKTIPFDGYPPYEVDNYDGEAFGNIDLVNATARSVNTVYAQLAADVGLREVARTARELGIETELPLVPSMSLGSAQASPLEMLRAYMTFGTRGQRVTPYFVRRVTDRSGTVLFSADPQREEVYPEDLADVVNHSLTAVVRNGTGRAASFGRPAAGKTGTTSGNTDAWFVGYTPRIGTAVWMGYQSDTKRKMENVHGRAVTGGSFPAQIFQRYMRVATQGMDTGTFTAPKPELLQAGPNPTGPPPTSDDRGDRDDASTTSTSLDDSSTTSSSTSSSTTTTTDRRATTTTTAPATTTTTAAATTTTTPTTTTRGGNGNDP